MALPLMQSLLVPAIFVPIVYVLGRKIGKYVGWLTFLGLGYALALLCLVGLDVLRTGVGVLEEYAWAPIAGLRFGLLADGLSLPIVATIAFLCTIDAVYSVRYMEHRIHEEYHRDNYPAHATYYALYLMYAIGMMGTVLATNLIEFYLFFELMLVPSWALINSYGYGERERIGIMYFLWTHIAAVLMLAGILAAYVQIGSFEIADMVRLAGMPMAPWVAAAMFIGFFTKMAVFGLHIWLPYAHSEAPTPISALLSPAMIGIAAYASSRILIIPLAAVIRGFSPYLEIWALITMVYGGLMALAQDDIKRLLAYSSISQMGYIFLGLSSVTTLGLTGSLFHYISHGTAKFILFAVAGVLICQAGIRSIKRLGGLAARMPITATAFIIGFLGIVGAPPLNGFQSKWLLFVGFFDMAIHGGTIDVVVGILALLSTAITVGYALWTIRRIFFGPLPEHLKAVKEAPAVLTVPLLLSAIVSVVLGVYPRLVTDLLIPVLKVLAG